MAPRDKDKEKLQTYYKLESMALEHFRFPEVSLDRQGRLAIFYAAVKFKKIRKHSWM